MTTVQINLPDELANDAQAAGLLSPEAIEAMLRARLKAQQTDELFEAMDRMAAVDTPAPMSPEEVAEEIRLMRSQKLAKIAG
jgi:hypothetical protein